MALYTPGNDPFSAFTRGATGSIADILAIEREIRQRKMQDVQQQLLNMQLGGMQAAQAAVSGAKTSVPMSPEEVSGGLADLQRAQGGTVPPEEWATTAGPTAMPGRRPETGAEAGWTPYQESMVRRWQPEAITTMGIRAPLEQAAFQKQQAARTGLKNLLTNFPKDPSQMADWMAKAISFAGDDPQMGRVVEGAMNPLLHLSMMDPEGTHTVTSAYWNARQRAQAAGQNQFQAHTAGLNAAMATYGTVKDQTFDKALQSVHGFAPQPPAHMPGYGQMWDPEKGEWVPVGQAKTSPTDDVMREWLNLKPGEKLPDNKQKLVDVELGKRGAPKERADAYAKIVQDRSAKLKQDMTPLAQKMANGTLTDAEKTKAIKGLDDEIKSLQNEIKNGEAAGLEKQAEARIAALNKVRQSFFEYQPGTAGSAAGPARGPGRTQGPKTAKDFFEQKPEYFGQ